MYTLVLCTIVVPYDVRCRILPVVLFVHSSLYRLIESNLCAGCFLCTVFKVICVCNCKVLCKVLSYASACLCVCTVLCMWAHLCAEYFVCNCKLLFGHSTLCAGHFCRQICLCAQYFVYIGGWSKVLCVQGSAVCTFSSEEFVCVEHLFLLLCRTVQTQKSGGLNL